VRACSGWTAADNAATGGLGLHQTVIGADVPSELDAIFARLDRLARTAGFSSWMDLGTAATTITRTTTACRAYRRRSDSPAALDRHHARELATLWAMIWRNQADLRGVRCRPRSDRRDRTGAHRNRRTSVPGATFQGKGGGLPGLINNDAGVFTLPSGHRYAIACLLAAAPHLPANRPPTPNSPPSPPPHLWAAPRGHCQQFGPRLPISARRRNLANQALRTLRARIVAHR